MLNKFGGEFTKTEIAIEKDQQFVMNDENIKDVYFSFHGIKVQNNVYNTKGFFLYISNSEFSFKKNFYARF